MKLKNSILGTHVLTSVASIAVFAMLQTTEWPLAVAAGGASLAGIGCSWCGQRRFLKHLTVGMKRLEESIATGDSLSIDDTDLRDWADSIRLHVQRWTELASRSRHQLREIESIVMQLDRRSKGSRDSSSTQLRSLLASLARQCHIAVQQMNDCAAEISRDTQALVQTTQHNSEGLRRATARSAKLCESLSGIGREMHDGCQQLSISREASGRVSCQATSLAGEMAGIRNELKTGEAKLRVVNEQSDEITATLTQISQLSARTDMLALNASIESIRAGEQGRGFAAVADEIRKLAEQAVQASENVADQLGLMQEGVRAAAAVMSKERTGLDGFSHDAEQLREGVEEIRRACEASYSQFAGIMEKTDRQQVAARELIENVEQLHDSVGHQTQRAEEVLWRTQTTTEAADTLTAILRPLAQLAQNSRADDTVEPLGEDAAASLLAGAASNSNNKTFEPVA